MASKNHEKIVEAGIRISAAGAGGWLSPLFGVEGGAAAAEAISEAGTAAVAYLAGRKRDRVARTLTGVSENARVRKEAGEQVRSDIIDSDSGGAIVLFEAVVEAAAQSIEERKCEVIANVYSAVAFDPTISIEDALHYIGRIRDCSWRQLTVVQYLLDEDRSQERAAIAREDEQRNVSEPRRRPAAFLAELSALGATLELIGTGVPGGTAQNPNNLFGGAQVTTQSVADMTATAVGRRIADLGQLAKVVSKADLDQLSAELAELPPQH
jgi:hypothetical protein